MVIEIVVANYVEVFVFFPPVMSCGMPVPPINGSIAGQDFSLGARAAYQCNPGFRLTGSVPSSVICQESGSWSPTDAPPRCLRKYYFPPAPPFQVTLAVFTSETLWMVFTDFVWPPDFSSGDLSWHWPLGCGTREMEANIWNPKPIRCYHDACMWPGILLQGTKDNSLSGQWNLELSRSQTSLWEYVQLCHPSLITITSI